MKRLVEKLFGQKAPASVVPVAESKVRPFVLGNTETCDLPGCLGGRHLRLHVALPWYYYQQPERKFPGVYLCDGYWYFALLNSLYHPLAYDKVVPEHILVGLSYAEDQPNYEKLRQRDLSPVRLALLGRSGEGAEFLDTLCTQVVPYIEAQYRIDGSYRVLAGGSLGGLFSLFSMFARPGFFRGHIAASPSVALTGGLLDRMEDQFARSGSDLVAQLFMSCGSEEPVDYCAPMRQFFDRLQARGYPSLRQNFKVIEGEGHSTSMAEAMNRGLRFAFEPLAPGRGA
jgi:uncharacterized protein